MERHIGFATKGTALGIAFATILSTACSSSCNPQEEPMQCLYGPPPLEEEQGNDLEPPAGTQQDEYDTQENVEPSVYGPPEDYDPEANVMEEVYGPPEWYEQGEPAVWMVD